MFILCGRTFNLAKVGLVRAGCPQELSNTFHNRIPGASIIITKNYEKLGYVKATDYYPSGIIVAGAATRNLMLRASLTRTWAYVEAGALEVHADDAIGSSELMSKLDALLLDKLYGATKQPISGQPWPYIQEVYPFENYFVYTFKGQRYRQGFALDPVERKVALRGGSVAVKEMFVDAGESKESMPRVQTGVRYAYAPPKGNNQSFTTGGKNSELVTQLIRNWSDILEAVAMYLNYIRNSGKPVRPMTPTFHPVTLSPAHKIVAALQAKGIDVYDFARWTSEALVEAATKGTKSVGTGEHVSRSQFAYVGDANDPSTWKLPIHDASHARNALARVNQTKGIPESAKAGVLLKIKHAAKKHGVDVSTPSTGQKKWMHKKTVKSDLMPVMAPQVPSTMSRSHPTSRG
jgi:hypothetical protein